MRLIRASTLVLLFSLTACGELPEPPSEPDAGTPDVEQTDAGTDLDAGYESDAGDAGEQPDAGGLPPDTRIDTAPPSMTASREATFVFSSTMAGSSFECALDTTHFTPCSPPTTYSALDQGPHQFRVRAISADGLADPTPAVHAWTVTGDGPASYFIATPTSEGASEPAVFLFDSDDSRATFECALDGEPFEPCTSPALRIDLAPGPHQFEVRAIDRVGNVEREPSRHEWTVASATPVRVRMLAANITSGNHQSYTLGHGTRIFQGLQPDIVMIQEFKYDSSTPSDIRDFVDEAFGPGFVYVREPNKNIPNGVVSRFPIIEWGVWDDPRVNDREFVWARIDVPGPKDLWAISVHLLTKSTGERNLEAQSLVGYVKTNVPEDDYLVIAGDLNTGSRTESCISTLSQVVVTAGPWPVDQDGIDGTNAKRTKPYDWVLPDPDLAPLEIPLQIGSNSFTHGLVFDSRVYEPLDDVAPVLEGDSGAPSMQHMAVGKDFLFAP